MIAINPATMIQGIFELDDSGTWIGVGFLTAVGGETGSAMGTGIERVPSLPFSTAELLLPLPVAESLRLVSVLTFGADGILPSGDCNGFSGRVSIGLGGGCGGCEVLGRPPHWAQTIEASPYTSAIAHSIK